MVEVEQRKRKKKTKYFYHFVKGGNDALNGIRRETMFINLLRRTSSK